MVSVITRALFAIVPAVCCVSTVVRADCTATTPCTIVVARNTATSLIVANQRVFWTDGARVLATSKFGGTAVSIAQDGGASLDGSDGAHVYWHTQTAVRRVAFGGGLAETLYSYGSNAGTFTSVEVLPPSLYVASERAVWKLSLDGSTPRDPNAFVANNDGQSFFVPATGSIWQNSFPASDGMDVRIERGHAIVADVRHGTPALLVLSRHRVVRIQDARATVLANQQDEDGHVALVGDDVYWTNPQSGTVRKTSAVYGGAITTIATGQARPFFIAADADSIYWTTDTAIMRVTPR